MPSATSNRPATAAPVTSLQAQPAPRSRTRIAGLDGLRAIAVVGVLLYHADVEWARGGFLGVDIFFVLSGYLVTSIVLANLARTGGLGFGRFWSARLRRLAPAQTTMIVAVILVVAIGFRDELAGLRSQVIAAFTGTTNWYLIFTNGSYFDQTDRPDLLRHLWSLAIELQFYLVFPIVLIFMMRRWRDRLDLVAAVLATSIVASAIYMAVLFDPADPSRAYFDTFARLSAPLVGALLALLWRPRNLGRSAAAKLGPAMTMLGAAGLVGLVWMLHVAGDRSAFMYRGGFLLAAALAGLVVASLTHPNNHLGGRFALGSPALVAIGLRSYGLYLWHWPIFMLTRPRIDVGWSWGTTFVVRIVLTVGLTELCYRFIERPWHDRAPDASWAGVKRRLLQPSGIRTVPRLLALGSTAAVLAAIVVVARPPTSANETNESLRAGLAALAEDGDEGPVAPSTTDPASTDPPTEGSGPTSTTAPPAEGTGTATLVGDSVMVGAVPDLQAAFGDRANINAEVSRQAGDISPVITQLGIEGRLGDTVVVQVGINGTVTDENLRDIVAAADGRRTLIVNARVPRSWEKSNNALIAELVPELDNAAVVDWFGASDSHRDWFLDDGVHLTNEGRTAYAALLRSAVDS